MFIFLSFLFINFNVRQKTSLWPSAYVMMFKFFIDAFFISAAHRLYTQEWLGSAGVASYSVDIAFFIAIMWAVLGIESKILWKACPERLKRRNSS